ncbi:MAG TPA: hypothetical protein VF384_07030 [Planctomycetota bacterium]
MNRVQPTAAMALRRATTSLCLVVLASCHVPARVLSVADRPGAFGSPVLPAAVSAAAGTVQAGGPTSAPSFAVGRSSDELDAVHELGSAELSSTWITSQHAGRLNLFADPGLFWSGQDPQPGTARQEPGRQDPGEARWSDFLPLGREAVIAAGYELPRAFGFGVAYTRLRRDIEVNEVRVGLNGAPPDEVTFLDVEADSVVDNVMSRVDAWIFPFWNVSVLGGWTWNDSASQVTVNLPGPNPRTVTFDVPTNQEGATWGFGTNLSAGYREWFISGDGQWIKADMSDFSVIEIFLGSIRTGWNGKIDGVPVRCWGGFTYWGTATTIEGSAATPEGTLQFEVEQGPVTPYSIQVGGTVEWDKAYGLVLEYHMLEDVRMLVFSAGLRF